MPKATITRPSGTKIVVEGTPEEVGNVIAKLEGAEERGRKGTAHKERGKKAVISTAPIPVDLKGGNGKPSLRDFFTQKSPIDNQEKVTVFVYYLNKHGGIDDVLVGHVISCYNEVGERKPVRIGQMFYDIKHLKGWLDLGSVSRSVKISIAGENLVEHDLPRARQVGS